jgi:hypothetical protein
VNAEPRIVGGRLTLFHVLWFYIVCLCGFWAGRLFSQQWGTLGWLAGVPAGLVSGYFAFHALRWLVDFYYWIRPLRPKCSKGMCRSEDYAVKVTKKEGNWETEFRCKCGETYLTKGNRFMILLPDRTTQPYMLRKPFHNWEPDK